MRKIVVCSVRDVKANAFAQPMFFPTIAFAQRAFTDHVNEPNAQNAVNKHPADYELWCLGLFDEDDGVFEAPTDFRRMLCRGDEVVNPAQ